MDPSHTHGHDSTRRSGPNARHDPETATHEYAGGHTGAALSAFSLAPQRQITMAKDAEKTNDRLFPMFHQNLSGDNLNAFRQTAEKLAIWLSNEKAYYQRARTKIMELLETSYATVCRHLGTPVQYHLPLIEDQDQWSFPFVKMLRIVLQYHALFPEPLLQIRLRNLAKNAGVVFPEIEFVKRPAGSEASPSSVSGSPTTQAPSTRQAIVGVGSPPAGMTSAPMPSTAASLTPSSLSPPRANSGPKIKPKPKKRFALNYLQVDLDEFDKTSKGGPQSYHSSDQAPDETEFAQPLDAQTPTRTDAPLLRDSPSTNETSPKLPVARTLGPADAATSLNSATSKVPAFQSSVLSAPPSHEGTNHESEDAESASSEVSARVISDLPAPVALEDMSSESHADTALSTSVVSSAESVKPTNKSDAGPHTEITDHEPLHEESQHRTVLWYFRGDCESTISVEFDFTPEQTAKLGRWTDRNNITSDISSALCLTLGCYRWLDCVAQISSDTPPSIAELSQVVPLVAWPDDGRLWAELQTGECRTSIPLAPPLQLRSERLVDISGLVRSGRNVLRINLAHDHPDLVFMIHIHIPTQDQLDELERRRSHRRDWKASIESLGNMASCAVPKFDWNHFSSSIPV